MSSPSHAASTGTRREKRRTERRAATSPAAKTAAIPRRGAVPSADSRTKLSARAARAKSGMEPAKRSRAGFTASRSARRRPSRPGRATAPPRQSPAAAQSVIAVSSGMPWGRIQARKSRGSGSRKKIAAKAPSTIPL